MIESSVCGKVVVEHRPGQLVTRGQFIWKSNQQQQQRYSFTRHEKQSSTPLWYSETIGRIKNPNFSVAIRGFWGLESPVHSFFWSNSAAESWHFGTYFSVSREILRRNLCFSNGTASILGWKCWLLRPLKAFELFDRF